MVYELRRRPGTRRLDPDGDDRYHTEVEKAKAKRNEILIRTGQRLRELARVNGPARTAISQVGLSLRVLREFINNRFPQPTKPSLFRHMSSPASPDLSKDPLEAFADRWVERIGKPTREPVGEIMRRLRNHPVNRDWDEERRKVRERSVEQMG